ncbi:hypothetical protein AGR1B_Cc40207 [Agrobacterium fabacearum S56]|nr:hypothetical protein AGR1B_Cc40207 [Agrobacterium fabacearum S56]
MHRIPDSPALKGRHLTKKLMSNKDCKYKYLAQRCGNVTVATSPAYCGLQPPRRRAPAEVPLPHHPTGKYRT